MNISRFSSLPQTDVRISGDGFTVSLSVRSRHSKRHRRQIILSLFRLVRPHFSRLEAAMLCHSDSAILDFVKEMRRPVSVYQALNLEAPLGQEGFQIRLLRLGFGRTQEELAKLAEVNRSQLSRIEHGRLKMSPFFRARLELAFKKLEVSRNKNAQKPMQTGRVFLRRDARMRAPRLKPHGLSG